jgi:hypothetical protein
LFSFLLPLTRRQAHTRYAQIRALETAWCRVFQNLNA